MKTQNWGRSWAFRLWPAHPGGDPTSAESLGRLTGALKNYEDCRETGQACDDPKSPYPGDNLSSVTTTWGEFDKDFTWERDKERGYPDKADRNRYWFTIIHEATGTRLTGFSQEVDYERGFPDSNGRYWYYVKFHEEECAPIRKWMEEKDRNYLRRIQKEDPELYKKEIENHPDHPPVKQHLEEERKRNQGKMREKARRQPSQKTSPDESTPQAVLIAYKELKLGELLGKGGFGAVYAGQWRNNPVAIKKVLLQQLSQELQEAFHKEADVMIKLEHPNIIKLRGIVLIPEFCLVLEFMANGSLDTLLHSEEPLNWQMRYNIGLGIAAGLMYLHKNRIIHRDLKSLNVLLDDGGEPKLGDFGLAKIKTTTMASTTVSLGGGVGTARWMAPELFGLKPKYSYASDMYAFAMVLWELMSRQWPYYGVQDNTQVVMAVARGEREELPRSAPQIMQSLTQLCWAQAPDTRPSAEKAHKKLLEQPVTDTTPVPSPHR